MNRASASASVRRETIFDYQQCFAKMERLALVDKSAKGAKKIIAQKARSHT